MDRRSSTVSLIAFTICFGVFAFSFEQVQAQGFRTKVQRPGTKASSNVEVKNASKKLDGAAESSSQGQQVINAINGGLSRAEVLAAQARLNQQLINQAGIDRQFGNTSGASSGGRSSGGGSFGGTASQASSNQELFFGNRMKPRAPQPPVRPVVPQKKFSSPEKIISEFRMQSTEIFTNSENSDELKKAEWSFKHGDYMGAKEAINNSIKLDSDNGLLHLFSAHIQLAVGDYQQSVADLENATFRLRPQNWDSIVRNHRVLIDQEAYTQQLNRLNDHIANGGTDLNAKLTRAFHMGLQGNYKQTWRDLDAILKLDPEHVMANRIKKALTARQEQAGKMIHTKGVIN